MFRTNLTHVQVGGICSGHVSSVGDTRRGRFRRSNTQVTRVKRSCGDSRIAKGTLGNRNVRVFPVDGMASVRVAVKVLGLRHRNTSLFSLFSTAIKV